MAHTNCPNGHDMWNGDGKPVVWAFRVNFFRDFLKGHPDCILGMDGKYGELFDCVDNAPGEDLDCWYCEKCDGVVVFVDLYRYDFTRMKSLPPVDLTEVAEWEEYIAMREPDFENFQEFYEGKNPVEAIDSYPFKTKFRVSPDKKTIYAFDSAGNIQFGYKQASFKEFDSRMEIKYQWSDGKETVYKPFKNYETPTMIPRFSGQLKRIQLISNNMCYGPCPEPEDEIEQRLTITEDGHIWLSRYCYGKKETSLTLMGKEAFSIPSEDAEYIMEKVTEYFKSDFDIPFVTDVGSWELTLTNAEGMKYKVSGPLCQDLYVAEEGLSDIIRSRLGRNDLFVFDANPDAITRLEIKYHRITKIKPEVPLPGSSFEYVTWDYNESLVFDRDTETLEHICEIGSGCKVTHTYQVEGGISTFLDDQGVDILSHIEDAPEDVIENPLEKKEYTITIQTKNGLNRTIEGTFDRDGLPEDWADFIENVLDFIRFYGLGEIFDDRIYRRGKRRESDLIFCKVEFEEGGQTYTYLADTDEYEIDDLVVVPAGPDNREAVVGIDSIEYRQPEDAPFPIEKTKHILRKYEKVPSVESGQWKDLFIPNSTGSENGVVIHDEEYAGSCRITLEKCPRYYAITCGVYGAMVHTAFCDEEKSEEMYKSMKKELQEFIDSDTDEDEEQEFYENFTTKY